MASSALTVDAVLLAGGRSSRMGCDKALLPHPATGLPLIEHQLRLLRAVTGAPPLLSLRAEVDYPGFAPDSPRIFDDGTRGPLAALRGILAVSRATQLLVLAVDMPGVEVADLRVLLALVTATRGALILGPTGPEPLLAVYPRAQALLGCETLLAENRLALRALADLGLREGWLAPVRNLPARALLNWNTPSDTDAPVADSQRPPANPS